MYSGKCRILSPKFAAGESFQLLNALEEYRTGQHVKKDFSEAEYANYYRTILNNLQEMEVCDTFGPVLQEIREDIFDTGWYVSYNLLCLSFC